MLIFRNSNMTVGLSCINKSAEKQNSMHNFNKIQTPVNQLISHPKDFNEFDMLGLNNIK